MDRKTKYLADFALAGLLLLAANLLTIPAIDAAHKADPRTLSLAIISNKIGYLAPEKRYAFAMFGDSRSQPLEEQDFCSALPAGAGDCLNASSTAGDWLTVYLLFEKLRPHLEEEAPLLVFVSDYWLESPSMGLIHQTHAYFELDEPFLGIESNLPMSAMRSTRMDWVRENLSGLASALGDSIRGVPGQGKTTRAAMEKVFRSNVDRWFAPIDDDTRARSQRIGDKVLQHMKRAGHPVILAYLPNLAARDEYVDLHYPGRRDRFHSTLAALAAAHDLPLLDLSASVVDRESFRDFHHLNALGREQVNPILGRRLKAAGVPRRPLDP